MPKKKNILNVFTDGSCINNGMSNASAGLGIYWGDNSPDNLSRKLKGVQSSDRAELMAVATAINQAARKGEKKIQVNTDSYLVFHAVTKKIPEYKEKNWKIKDPLKSEIVALDHAMSKLELVKIKKVQGHSGIHGNEQADRLAKDAARRR